MNSTPSKSAATLIQAHWKGYRIRKCILQTRSDYEEIAQEIESEIGIECGTRERKCLVSWPKERNICYPVHSISSVVDNKDDGGKIKNVTTKADISIQIDRQPGVISNVSGGDGGSTSKECNSVVGECTVLDGPQPSYGHQEKVNNNELHEKGGNIIEKQNNSHTDNNNNNHKQIHSTTATTEDDLSKDLPSKDKVTPSGHQQKQQQQQIPRKVYEKRSSSPIFEACGEEDTSLKDTTATTTFGEVDGPQVITKPCLLTESWMTDRSFDASSTITTLNDDNIIATKEDLLEQQKELMLELIWLQQAIHSRKVYLRLKRKAS